jgi:hypothetical protein
LLLSILSDALLLSVVFVILSGLVIKKALLVTARGTSQNLGFRHFVFRAIITIPSSEIPSMVEGGWKEKHILVHKRLDDGRVGRSGATPELLPLGKVMRRKPF